MAAGDQGAKAVAAQHRNPGQQGRRPQQQGGLELAAAAEIETGMQVRQQPDRPLTFLAKQFGVRPAAPRSDAPVDVAGVVAGRVGPHLLEFQAAPALGAAVRTLQSRECGAVRVQAEAMGWAAQRDQFREIRQDHGAGTCRRSSATHCWAVTPRACAV